MALRFAFVLLFSIAAFGLGNAIPAFPTQKCGANAEFRSCGSACEPTCANPNPGPICTLQCVIGCFCKEGFLMNSAGECVRPTECDAAPTVQPIVAMLHRDRRPVRCAVNEEFKQCKGCDDTCFSSNVPCPRICKSGCACKEGHVRMGENGDGPCVPRHQCPIIDPPVVLEVTAAVDPVDGKCAANEAFQPCGSACAPTCNNPHPSPICTKECVIGCYCQEGYLRNTLGFCIPAHQCQASEAPVAMAMPETPKCPANEFFNPCGSACAPTCENPNPSPVCTRQCVVGCFCREGLLRNENGECVQHHQCTNKAAVAALSAPLPPPVCGENEVMSACHLCDASCEHPTPLCKRILTLRMCRPGCACKEGHVRNADGQCIQQHQCPQTVTPFDSVTLTPEQPKCGVNEEFSTCGSFCPATCANPEKRRCTLRCKVGCFCKKGFLKNAQGVCVPETECHQPTTYAPVH